MSEEKEKGGGGDAGGGGQAKPVTDVHSTTTENRKGEINPSAPEDANTTPGTTADEVS